MLSLIYSLNLVPLLILCSLLFPFQLMTKIESREIDEVTETDDNHSQNMHLIPKKPTEL